MTDSNEHMDVGMDEVFNSLFSEKCFLMPGQVISFDRTLKTASVQPALKTLFQNEEVPRLRPVCDDVPVLFPGGGNHFVVFDLIPGSYVLLAFADRSIENWANLGGIADPQSTRMSDMSDAIAIPCLLPAPIAPGVIIDANTLTIQNLAGTTTIKVTDASLDLDCGGASVVMTALSGNVEINGNLLVKP